MVAGAKIHRAEQTLQRRVGDDVARIGRRRVQNAWWTVNSDGGCSARVQVAESNVENRTMDLHRLVVGQRGMVRPAQVPREICKLSYEAVELTPFVVEHGNPYLMSDVEVALELLLAGYHSALVMVKINQ